MGLGPWAGRSRSEAAKWGYCTSTSAPGEAPSADLGRLGLGESFHHEVSIMRGNPYDGSYVVNWPKIEELDGGTRPAWNDGRFGEVANLASSVQSNLEASAMALLASLRDGTGQSNLCFTGGVALNSVLNGRVVREGGFEQVRWVLLGWTGVSSRFPRP